MSDTGDDSCGTEVNSGEKATDFTMEDHVVSVKSHKKEIIL